jgi:hypothetical protein
MGMGAMLMPTLPPPSPPPPAARARRLLPPVPGGERFSHDIGRSGSNGGRSDRWPSFELGDGEITLLTRLSTISGVVPVALMSGVRPTGGMHNVNRAVCP